MRELVDEPRLADILHPCSNKREELAEEKEAIVPMAQ
jgi:hypothetical protein